MDEKMKRGQVAVWIIIAVVLLAAVLLFFFLEEGQEIDITTGGKTEFQPASFLGQCVNEYVLEVVDIMLPRGGFVTPKNYRIFDGLPVEYLCENAGFYDPCINQHPVLIQEMKREIDNYLTAEVNNCFNEFKLVIEEDGGQVSLQSDLDVGVRLGEDRVYVDIFREMTVVEKGETMAFDEFEFVIKSPAYNLAMIAMEIAAQEADYCYFEYVGYRILYPRYAIRPYTMSEPTQIYKITDSESGKFMNIAIRSCAIPAGF